MGTLRKLKMKMKFDRDWHKTLVRGSRNEILIDIDGDKEPDVAILDTTGNGDIDTLAVDLTGDGEFNLYISDTDGNGIPDLILMDEEGNGEVKVLGMGKDVENAIIIAASAVKAAIAKGDYIAEVLDAALDDLDREVKIARRQLRKLR